MVTFLATHSKRGNVRAVGPVTGIAYLITPSGTPVSDLDVEGLLEMTGPPCCGETLPFGGEVKLFGKTSASTSQFAAVPPEIRFAKPKKKMKKPTVKDKVEMEDSVVSVVKTETVKTEKQGD